MTALAGILMLAIAGYLVVYPLLRRPDEPSGSADAHPAADVDELRTRRDATYATLTELDLDYEMDKLSASDYQSLRAQNRALAVSILQELDAHQPEARGQIIQAALPDNGCEPDLAPVEQAPRELLCYCPGCGRRVQPQDRFCRRCGTELADELS